ncbi:MAG: glycosyltransferase family 4 protein [Candidatus Sphingomonas phytovorans]|nr:glycosyltransferase family 4 protein [Sphingomonas sp.]WEK02075.1 MAG: glycosyltransferase family 4 protein [Sphingomonas sp.]
MRTLLIQPGARHGYALARFLHKADALQRLYTDFAIPDGSFEHRLLAAAAGLNPKARSLLRRVVPDLPGSMLQRLSLAALIAKRQAPNQRERWNFRARDLREADVVYSQYFAGGDQIEELVAHGARFVSDVFIMPSAHRVVNRESAKFPEWHETPYSPDAAAILDSVSKVMIERSDGLFCPSQSVIDDVAAYDPAARAKCRLVRYGSSLTFSQANEPIPKRVLFAGSIQLRKGPQYLALAAARIARLDPSVRFVFAGGVTAAAASQLQAPNIEVLGHVSRDRMREEFLRADILAFPSLAEGSAGVVLEAMSAGLPIVATHEAGVDFRDGESGIIVPPTDVDALADAILEIVGDRPRREAMARSARAEFNAYDEERWGKTFVAALREFSRDG